MLINTGNPLVTGCWLKREPDYESWVEFHYERLQDFCYWCGRIGYAITECTADGNQGEAIFGDWLKAFPVRDVVENAQPRTMGNGSRRMAGVARVRNSSTTVPACSQPVQRTEMEEGHNIGNELAVRVPKSPQCASKKWRNAQSLNLQHNNNGGESRSEYPKGRECVEFTHNGGPRVEEGYGSAMFGSY